MDQMGLNDPKKERGVWKKQFQQEAVRELKDPILNLVTQLRPEINRGDYSAIVGDDASGRIPTLIVADVINAAYRQNGIRPPVLDYIAGSSGLERRSPEAQVRKKLSLQEYFTDLKRAATYDGRALGRVLFVTDSLVLGNTINKVLEAVKQSGWTADVAAVGTAERIEPDEVEKKYNNRIVIGMNRVPKIDASNHYSWAVEQLSGVTKEPENLYATPLINTPRFKGREEELQEAMSLARDSASQVASEIYKEYSK